MKEVIAKEVALARTALVPVSCDQYLVAPFELVTPLITGKVGVVVAKNSVA